MELQNEKPKRKKNKKKEVEVDTIVDEDQEVEEQKFINIEQLEEMGIAKGDIDKLKSAGFTTIESFINATKKSICEVKGISENKYEKMLKAVNEIKGEDGFQSSRHFLQIRNNLTYISTGSSDLDQLLRGGIETCNLTEFFGEFRTGKTQLCHTLCVTCQLPKSEGGGAGKAMIIDTEGTFRPEKLIPIAKRFNMDPEGVIDNVFYARAYNHEHQYKLLSKAAAIMSTDNFALLIVDSATNLYRTDFSGRGELAARQMHLAKFLRGLQKIADEFKVAVVFTNQVVATVDGGGYGGNDKKPIGGHIVAHAPQTRLYLRKGAKENRICKVYDSPTIPEGEAAYSINEDGIRNSNN